VTADKSNFVVVPHFQDFVTAYMKKLAGERFADCLIGCDQLGEFAGLVNLIGQFFNLVFQSVDGDDDFEYFGHDSLI
jgi:hypothetical protein